MDSAKSSGAHIPAPAQIYPDSKPVEVPPRPTWTGADPRVSQSIRAYTQMDEEELKESKKDQRHAYKDYTALLHEDQTLLR